MLKKTFKLGNSTAVIIGTKYEPGEWVDVEISPVEIRKINKDKAEESDLVRYLCSAFSNRIAVA